MIKVEKKAEAPASRLANILVPGHLYNRFRIERSEESGRLSSKSPVFSAFSLIIFGGETP